MAGELIVFVLSPANKAGFLLKKSMTKESEIRPTNKMPDFDTLRRVFCYGEIIQSGVPLYPDLVPLPKVDKVDVVTEPETDWAITVDKIEKSFSENYDQEEYGNNLALSLMGICEMRIMLSSFGVPIDKQLDYRSQPLAGKRFVVVGTGTGREVIALSALGASVVGFDATREYVEITAEKVQQAKGFLGKQMPVELYQSLAENPESYPSRPVDGISSLFGVIDHVEEWTDAIELISQSLKTGGRFALSVYGSDNALVFDMARRDNLPYKPSMLQGRADGGILLGKSEKVLPSNFPNSERVSKTLEENGFVVETKIGFLRLAALFPQDPTVENLANFLDLVRQIDQDAGNAIEQFSTPKKILAAAFNYDLVNQEPIKDFAYVAFVARKT